MSRGHRSSKGSKEYNDSQRLRHELDKAKETISRLRKQLQKVDVNRYQDIQDLIERRNEESDQVTQNDREQESLKSKWACHACNDGHLVIRELHRLDGVFYYRKCSNSKTCQNRTKPKRWHKDVEGIKANEDEEIQQEQKLSFKKNRK